MSSKKSPRKSSTKSPTTSSKPKTNPKAKPIECAPAVIKSSGTVPYSKLTDEQKLILATPSAFCRSFLKMDLYPKQAEIMDSMAKIYSRTSAACCNEAGKTSKIICGLILWNGAMFKRGCTVSTSGSWLQVTHQLVPHLKRYESKFPSWKFNTTDIKGPLGDKWIGFSTNDANRAEGWHGSVGEVLMALADEAKGVSDAIFTALEERVNPQRYGLFSSPGYAEGEFYRSHNKNRHLYQTFKITAADCPHITQASIDRRIAKWGINHPLIRSAIFAEFMEFIEKGMLSLAEWDACIENPPPRAGNERHAFVDFGGQGLAETVLGVRVGNEVWLEDKWNHRSEMASIGQLVILFNKIKREYGFQPHEIEGDADGIGGPMIDRLREVGWPISEFHGGVDALESTRYLNRISEVWFTGTDKIKKREIIIRDGFDEDLKGQIMSREQWIHSSGVLQAEPKKVMIGRGLPSPDRADALLGAMFNGYHQQKTPVITYDNLSWTDDAEVDRDVIAGMNAGM